MSESDTGPARISRAVPLDQLRQPETDVRDHRPQDQVKSLAASMGDPSVGQLQDVLVHPVLDELEAPPETAEELDELFRDGHPMRVVDGETRRLAAERLGWATLDCTIVPEPPEETIVAQLDANTERIDMTEAETVRALYDYYQETDATLDDVGGKTGFSASYLSRVFSLIESPEWLTGPWEHPDHPLETSHALAVMSLLSSDSLKRYGQAGNLDQEAARQKAIEDAKLMIDVQGQHDLQVGEFRKRVKRCRKETLDQLQDQRSLDEKRADGQTAKADRDHTPAEVEAPDPCLVCGGERPNRRKIAVNVCREDYGMLSEMQANGDVLMAQAEAPSQPAEVPADGDGGPQDLTAALAAELGIPEEQAGQVLGELQQQATQAQQEAADD
jgi:hypothetical protein